MWQRVTTYMLGLLALALAVALVVQEFRVSSRLSVLQTQLDATKRLAEDIKIALDDSRIEIARMRIELRGTSRGGKSAEGTADLFTPTPSVSPLPGGGVYDSPGLYPMPDIPEPK